MKTTAAICWEVNAGARTRDQRITKPTILMATVRTGNYLCCNVFDGSTLRSEPGNSTQFPIIVDE